MLSSLHIENIAVIRALDVDFTDGLCVITGETGAGKSVMLDAIGFLLGGRAARDLLRNGAAQGEVLARVEDTLCVQIPRVQEQKCYTERQNVQKTLIFFGKSIKLSKNTTTEGQNCDIIKRIEDVTLAGAVLPISLESEVALCYELLERVLDDEELLRRAYEQLGLELSAATEGAMLVSKQVTSELTDAGILLVCRYECIKNIAVSRPLSVTAE